MTTQPSASAVTISDWKFTPDVIAKAKELAIDDRVAVHWSEAECQDQEGTVVGVDIARHGKVNFTVHIDGDSSPTDGFYIDHSGYDAGSIRPLALKPAGGGEVVDVQTMLATGSQQYKNWQETRIDQVSTIVSPPAAPSKVVEGEWHPPTDSDDPLTAGVIAGVDTSRRLLAMPHQFGADYFAMAVSQDAIAAYLAALGEAP